MALKNLTDVSGRTQQNPIKAAEGIVPQEQLNKLNAAPQGEPASKTITPEIKVTTPFESRTLGVKGGENQPVVIGSVEDMLRMISTESEVEVKTLDDVVSKVLTPFKTLRGKVNEIPEMESKLNSLSSVITSMPEDLGQLVHTWMTGGNYQEMMSNQLVAKTIDFSKDFGDHNELKLINHFTKGNFTQETFTALDPSVQESLRVATRSQYDSNRRQLQAKPNISKVVEDRRAAFVESVDKSVAALKVQFPDMLPERIQEVRNTLLSGGHNKRLYSNDGMYKPNAAQDVSMMLYGSEAIAAQNATINQIMEMQLSKGASQTAESILNRSDKPTVISQGGTATPNQAIAEKVNKATAFLRSDGYGERF